MTFGDARKIQQVGGGQQTEECRPGLGPALRRPHRDDDLAHQSLEQAKLFAGDVKRSIRTLDQDVPALFPDAKFPDRAGDLLFFLILLLFRDLLEGVDVDDQFGDLGGAINPVGRPIQPGDHGADPIVGPGDRLGVIPEQPLGHADDFLDVPEGCAFVEGLPT